MSGATVSDRIQIIKSRFEWSVSRRDFDTPNKPEQSIFSKGFRACPDSISWFLRLYPYGDSTTINQGYVSLFVYARGIGDSVPVKFRVGFIGSDGTERDAKQTIDYKIFMKTETEVIADSWGFSQFVKRDMLLDTTKNFFREDQLTIFCDLEVQWDPEIKVPGSSLSQNLSRMLESGELSDVTLVVRKEKLKAHKVVLSAGSPVFAAMFKHPMKESQTGRVPIKDLDVVGVKALLDFLYSAEVKGLRAIAEKVLPAADKYAVDGLKALCEKELCEQLTVKNVTDLLILADLHSANKLKAHAMNFISLNSAEVAGEKNFWNLANINQDILQEAGQFLAMKSEKNSDGTQQVKRRKITTDSDPSAV